VLITGSNLAWAHPILMRRLEDARRARPAQRWIVIDPRRTETAALADLHLALRPGSDVALYLGLLHLMRREGWLDPGFIAAHTTGFEAVAARAEAATPARTRELTGIDEADLLTAARWFATSAASLSLYCQGLNQSHRGTDKNIALVHLHLATGQIGRAGAGPFSLTGQPNAMGGREVGGLANLLSAHRDLANPAHRAEVAAFWGVPSVPERPGRTAVEMFQAAADGEVKALWIACTNPAQSLPDQATVHRALERAEFVIVQEAFATTATAAYADLLLPATTWGEKEGTVTNSERRISRVRAAVPPAGEARADWAIAAEIARRLAARIAPERAALFAWPDAESVWREHRESTRGRDLDITGLDWARLETVGPQQWPLPEGALTGRARLYEDHRFATPDGRARFVDVEPEGVAEPVDADYPVALLTGRLRDQWHGTSRTGTLGRLHAHEAEPVVDLHPDALAAQGLADGDLVRVRSRRGELVLGARASDALLPGTAFVPMHWGPEVLAGDARGQGRALGVNGLTVPARCPRSGQPELKHAAVAIAPAALPWRLVALAWFPAAEALRVREALKPWLAARPFASLMLFGQEPDAGGRTGLALRVADAAAPEDAWCEAVAARLGLGAGGPDQLAFDDRARGEARRLRRAAVPPGADAATAPLTGFWLAGDVRAAARLEDLLRRDAPLPTPAWRALAPEGPSGERPPRSPQVCNCFAVDEARIRASLAAQAGDAATRLALTQAALRCGTQCGSCLPRLRTLAKEVAAQAPAGDNACPEPLACPTTP
jgi:assimilatory nitrate reductase catalytic subunit